MLLGRQYVVCSVMGSSSTLYSPESIRETPSRLLPQLFRATREDKCTI